jgi:hypothetical protein
MTQPDADTPEPGKDVFAFAQPAVARAAAPADSSGDDGDSE